MAENMFCKNQKTSSDKFRENWERTFRKIKEIHLSCMQCDCTNQECMCIKYEKGKPLYR
jgi:predicted nucleic acid-binding Zn ribbon protein